MKIFVHQTCRKYCRADKSNHLLRKAAKVQPLGSNIVRYLFLFENCLRIGHLVSRKGQIISHQILAKIDVG